MIIHLKMNLNVIYGNKMAQNIEILKSRKAFSYVAKFSHNSIKGLGCSFKVNCPHVGPGSKGCVLSGVSS